MNIPFTNAEFYGVFGTYNTAVWPMQLPLMALGVLAVALLVRERSYSSAGISAILTTINPLAYGFATLFVAGAVVFFWQGVIRRKLNFQSTGTTDGWRARAGWGLMIFAWFIYPAWTYFSGHRYPAFPTFGLPCPTTLFTIGLLAFLVRPYPRCVFTVPLLWCFIGSQAAFVFDVRADLGLIVAGVLGVMLVVQSKDLKSAPGKASNL